MTTECEIQRLLDGVITLPSLPATVMRLTELVEDPECDVKAVGTIISADPAIALKTLRLVNSAYSGLQQKVVALDHAIAMLGLKVIKNLVLTAAVFDTLESEMADFTRHSIACGFAMRHLVDDHLSSASVGTSGDAFIYGLLHDVGKVVFEQSMPDEFVQVLAKTRDDALAWYQAERVVFGCDHAGMGAELITLWKLPAELASAVGAHHSVESCPEGDRGAAALLALANLMADSCGYPSYPHHFESTQAEACSALGLEESDVDEFGESFLELLPAIEELVSVVGR